MGIEKITSRLFGNFGPAIRSSISRRSRERRVSRNVGRNFSSRATPPCDSYTDDPRNSRYRRSWADSRVRSEEIISLRSREKKLDIENEIKLNN